MSVQHQTSIFGMTLATDLPYVTTLLRYYICCHAIQGLQCTVFTALSSAVQQSSLLYLYLHQPTSKPGSQTAPSQLFPFIVFVRIHTKGHLNHGSQTSLCRETYMVVKPPIQVTVVKPRSIKRSGSLTRVTSPGISKFTKSNIAGLRFVVNSS